MRLIVPVLYLSVCALLSPSEAMAQTRSWMFLGQVDSVSVLGASDPALVSQFPTGAQVKILLTYNTNATDGFPSNTNVGKYSLTYGAAATVQQVDMEAVVAGHRYHHRYSGSNFVPIYVDRLLPQLFYDGTLTEFLAGEMVPAGQNWYPRALGFQAGWPGFPFASDALPLAFPHNSPGGTFELYLCPDPTGCWGESVNAVITGTLHTVRPATAKRIDVVPGSTANVISGSSALTAVAILGTSSFQPDVQVVRSSIRLSGAAPLRLPPSFTPLCSASDVNGDTRLDLVCQVVTSRIRPRAGEPAVRLIAETIDGNYIRGQDTAMFVP